MPEDKKEEEEQVIVIEDLEDESEPEELEKKENEENSNNEEGEEEGKSSLDESSLPSTHTNKKNKKLFIVISASFLVLIVLSILAFVIFHKKPIKKQVKTATVEKVIKEKIKPKKQPAKHEAYNPSVDIHFINAIRLQEKGNYKAAINELKQANLDLYLSYYSLGYIYLKLGDIEKAKYYMFDKTKEYLILSIENNPDYINGYINLFRVYMAIKNYDKALKIIKILKKKNISEKELNLMSAYYNYIINKDSKSVLSLYAKNPNLPLLNNLLGDIYFNQRKLNEAEKYFKKAVKIYSSDSSYYNMALIETQRGNYKKALSYIPKSVFIEFDKIKCKNYLSFFLLLNEKKFTKSLEYLNLNKQYCKNCYQYFNITPTIESSITPEDFILRKNINYMLAAEILNMYLKPIKLTAPDINAKIRLGDIYENLGLSEKAEEKYIHLASYAEAVLISQKAIKFYAKRNFSDSLKYYKKALSKSDTNPLLLYNTALLYAKNHKIDKAHEIFKQLSDTYPKFPLAFIGLFITKQLKGIHKDAIKYLNQFLKTKKDLPDKAKNNLADLDSIAVLITQNNKISKNFYRLDSNAKRIMVIIKAALNNDLDMLILEKNFEKTIGLNLDAASDAAILDYFLKNIPTNFIKRATSDYSLIKGNYKKAYTAMYNMEQYSAQDYYRLGAAYLLDGFPEVADNFFTKSIIKSDQYYNAYFAKVIMQASRKNLKGIRYYLKLMNNKMWMNRYSELSFNIKIK